MGANGLLTLAFTGEQPEGMDWWSFRDGGTDNFGKPTRWLLPSYLKDIFAYIQDPVDVIFAKTHPMIGLVKDIAKNRDYYRTEIFNKDDNLILQGVDIGTYTIKQFIPFWMRGVSKAAESEGGLEKAFDKSPASLVAPQIGIMPTTRSYTMTPFEKEAEKIIKGKIPEGSRTKEQAEKTKLKRKLESDLRRGDDDAKDKIRDAMKEGSISNHDAESIMKNAKIGHTQKVAKQLGLDDLAKAVKKASDEEKEIIKPIFKKKLLNKAKDLSQEQKARYIEILKGL